MKNLFLKLILGAASAIIIPFCILLTLEFSVRLIEVWIQIEPIKLVTGRPEGAGQLLKLFNLTKPIKTNDIREKRFSLEVDKNYLHLTHHSHEEDVEVPTKKGTDIWTQYQKKISHHKKNFIAYHRATTVSGNQKVFDVKYTIDQYGRRLVPYVLSTNSAQHHWILSGCSFTFGEGLTDDQTLPAYLQKESPQNRIYNVADMGGSIVTAIISLTELDVWNDITPSKGLLLLMHDSSMHFNRFMGTLKMIGRRDGYVPFLEKDDEGHYQYGGMIKFHKPFKAFVGKVVANSRLLSLIKFDWPIVNYGYLKEYATAIADLKKYYLKKYPGSEIVVVLIPNGQDEETFIPTLESQGIFYLDYSNLKLEKYSKYPLYIKYDGHPTEEYNRLFAKQLAHDLKNHETRRKLVIAQ